MQQVLEEEIKNVFSLDHPNIVKFYQCCYDNTYINIVQEYIQGENLDDYVSRMGRVPEKDTKYILGHIASAMKYMHARGIVHRDLKLENIIIVKEENKDDNSSNKDGKKYSKENGCNLRAKIIDFGLSKLTESHNKELLDNEN